MSNQYETVMKSPGFRQRGLRIAAVLGAIALIAALGVSGIGAPSGRASADTTTLEAIFGTVVEVSPPDSITVATDSGVSTIIITGEDVFNGDITAVEDISEGDRIVGSVHIAADGTTTADKLLVVPDLTKSVTRHVLGVILDSRDGVIEIQDQDGNTITIDVPEGVGVPAVGTVVTVVAQLDRTTGRLLAQAFDRVEDAVQRIQDAKDRVTDAVLKAELEERLERARDQHLSALDRARESLDRARQAVESAIAERDEAQRRLEEIQSRFDDLRQRYVQEASNRNERLPELRTEGTINYDNDEWLEPSGTFSLTPRINDADESVLRKFTWNEKTLAIVPVEIKHSDPSSPAITATTAQSVALPLNDVKGLIPAGSQVIVQFDPNTEPAPATLITVLPPELPDAIADALERERLRSITGSITLVEETPGLDDATGIVVVVNREHDIKVAAKITESTEIFVDGDKAEFMNLAAGMLAEIEFAESQAELDNASGAGRLDALRIRASTIVDDNDVHVAGVVADLDLDAKTVGILTRDGDVVKAQVLDDAVIVKDGSPARFPALEVGDLVLDATRFNRDTLVLTRLVVQSPRAIMFSGAITGLDRNPERLTITTADGRVLVVFITQSSRLQAENGSTLEFSDLSVGNRVITGEALPVQRDGGTLLVAARLVIGNPDISNARGIVRKVSVSSGEIAIEVPGSSAIDAAFAADLSETITLSVADNNRSVLQKNDERIRSLAPVEPGDIVESVSYVTSTGVIVKMSVVSPNLQRVRGTVSAVTNSGLAVDTASGQVVGLAVTDFTVVTLDGRRIDSLRPVHRGDIVVEAIYVSGEGNPSGGAALRLTLISRPDASDGSGSSDEPGDSQFETTPLETTISGVIEEIQEDSWKISGRRFAVTSDTEFFGENAQLGLVAKATLVTGQNGGFVAISISVAGRPDTNPSTRPIEVQPVEPGDAPDDGDTEGLLRILGRVQNITQTTEGSIVIVDGVRVSIFSNTVIVGDVKIGSEALAVVRRTPSGTVVAVSVVFTEPSSPDSSANNSGDAIDPVDTGNSGDDTTPAGPAGQDNQQPDSSAGGGSADGAGSNGTGTVQAPGDAPADEDTVFITRTISVDLISGRIIIADGEIYLLTALEVFGLRAGNSITVAVRKVEGDRISTDLDLLDRLVLTGNPLYKEVSSTGNNPVFVSD